MMKKFISMILLHCLSIPVSAFCAPSGRAGRFLDLLLVVAEGGEDAS